MADECTFDYSSPPSARSTSPRGTWTTLVLTLLLLVTFVSSVLLRRHQLSLPDPYNNPYTDWSTACLLALPVLAVGDAIALAVWRQRIARPVLIPALAVLGLAGLYVVWFIVGLVGFLFP